MSVKTTGTLFKKFYADTAVWDAPGGAGDEGWYAEGLYVIVDGHDEDMDAVQDRLGDNFERLSDAAQVEIKGGELLWQGRGKEPARLDRNDLVTAFAQWEKAQTSMTVVATLELDKQADFERHARALSILAALGASVTLPVELDGSKNTMDLAEHARIAAVIASLMAGA